MGNNTAYSFNCSAPPDGVHFVHSPPVRGTLDIAWSCFAILLLSTWETVNLWDELDIPRPAKTRGQRLKRLLVRNALKLQSMIVAVLAPEYITANAVDDHFHARYIYGKGLEYATKDGVDWTVAKAYYASIKGFRLEYDESRFTTPGRRSTTIPKQTSDSERSTMLHVDTGEAHDLQSLSSEVETDPDNKAMVLTGDQLLYLRELGVLDSLPALSSEDLDDRNKSNGLVQALALIQTVWLITQVIARSLEGLWITQLEIVTLAFAVLSFITRLFDWRKPKDVRTTTPVYATRYLTRSEKAVFDRKTERILKSRHYNNSMAAVVVAGLLFGGLHCLAWNEKFPTNVEQLLWRVATVVTTSIPILIPIMTSRIVEARPVMLSILALTSFLAYSVGRTFIMAETVRALFYQQPDAFIATWTTNFPHLG